MRHIKRLAFKLGALTTNMVVEVDASIIAPLMFAYILGW